MSHNTGNASQWNAVLVVVFAKFAVIVKVEMWSWQVRPLEDISGISSAAVGLSRTCCRLVRSVSRQTLAPIGRLY